MSWNSETKTLTAPMSTGDISYALSNSSLDLGSLIQRGTINKWAKFKPVKSSLVNIDKQTLVTTYASGMSCVTGSTQSQFVNNVVSAMSNPDYQWKGELDMIKYTRPDITSGDMARALDLDGYIANSELDMSFPQSAGYSVGRTWSDGKIMLIDKTENLNNKTLSDDTSQKTYYRNNMLGANVVSRPLLHIYDIMYYGGGYGSDSGAGLHPNRGVIFFTEDGEQYVFVGTVPFKDNGTFRGAISSPTGKTSTVCEFYCTPGSKYVAIPGMTYDVTGYSRFSFEGTFVDSNDGYVYITFNHDALWEVFGELHICLKISSDGTTWDRVQTTDKTIVYNHELTSDYSDRYDYYFHDDIGKYVCVEIYGNDDTSVGSVNDEIYYTTEDDPVQIQ